MTQAFFTRTTRTQCQFSCREKRCKYTRTQGRVQIVAGSLRHCGAQLVRNMIGRHVLVPQNSSECFWVSSVACSLTCLFCFSLAALATDQVGHGPRTWTTCPIYIVFRRFVSLRVWYWSTNPKILCMFLQSTEKITRAVLKISQMECWPEVYAHTYQDARRQAESHLWKPCGQWISCMLTPSPAFYWIWSPAMSVLAEEGDSCQFPSLCSLSGVWFAFATPLQKKHPEASYSQRCPLGLRCPYAHGAKVGTCWHMLEEDVALKCQIDSGSLLCHRIPSCS